MLRKFRNRSEDHVQRQIRAVIKRHGAELHEKVRIADLIDISKLDQRELGTYALQAHFDFVLIDDALEAVFALEFDGPGHVPANDYKKDLICQQAELPLFRVQSFEEVHEINSITFIRYLVELVFHARVFLQMKEQGQLAPDEPFMLSGFLKEDAKNIWDSEFHFVANANSKLNRALKKANLAEDAFPHFSINRLVLRSPDERLRAFMSINSLKGPIIGTSSVRITLASWGFLANVGTISAEIAQFADGMAADDLLENIRLVGDGFGHVVADTDEVLSELKTLKRQGYTLVLGGGGSRSQAKLLAALRCGYRDGLLSASIVRSPATS